MRFGGGVVAVVVVPGILAFIIGYPLAYAMAFKAGKWRNVMMILVIAPFFVMPPVAASILENLFMHPQNGLFAAVSMALGYQPILFLQDYPMLSVIGIVSWEWLPFATLILLTALQSLSSEQLEAADSPFATLVQTLLTQSLVYLGGMGSRGGQPILNLDAAKRSVDMLGALDEKTKGNLSELEQKLLDTALYEARSRFVSVASQFIGP